MLQLLFNCFKTVVTHPAAQLLLRIASVFSLISSAVVLLGCFLYSIGYSFLYGYYFSGDSHVSFSIINLLILAIPFPFHSVMITSIVFLTAAVFFVILLLTLGQGIKKIRTKNERSVGFAVLALSLFMMPVLFQWALMIFFGNGLSRSSGEFFQFGLIWAGPFSIAIAVAISMRITKSPYSAVAGFLYGAMTVSIAGAFTKHPPSIVWLIAVFGVMFLFTFFEHWLKYTVYRFFLWLPAAALLCMIALIRVPESRLANDSRLLLLIILSCAASLSLALLIGRKKLRAPSNAVIRHKPIARPGKPFRSPLILLLIAAASFFVALVPAVSSLTGSYFRLVSTDRERGIITYNRNETIPDATVVAHKNGIYYISSSERKLIVLQTDRLKFETGSRPEP